MNQHQSQPPLAIVGLSALFPKSANLDEFWSNLRRGTDAITEVPASHWNPDDYFDVDQKTPDMTYARRGGFLSPVPFDPLEYGISPNNLEAIDTSQLLGLVGAKRALEHAGYGSGRVFDRSRVSCILGVTGTLEMVIPLGARLGHPRWRKALRDAGVADEVANDVVNRISQSYVPWQENSFPGLLGNVVAGRIANRLDLHGTNCVVDAACASSLSAIHLAALELWTGRSDMVVTGGIDTFNDIFMFMCFSKTPALSPTGDSRPFSEDADGTILGEGVGILVLKRLQDAERDGDRIYAVLKGIGTSSDGAGNAVYAPKADGQIRCLQDAYRVAGVSPATIELVEAHGTGTKVGDATEVSGLLQVFRESGRKGTWCAVGSVKSQIGHTKAAAGAAGVIKAVLALRHRVLPPTIKVKQPPASVLADDSPFYVNTEPRPWLTPNGYPRRAAVSAFGFGGSNFHCVLEESPQKTNEMAWDHDVQIVAISGGSAAELQQQLQSRFAAAPADWQQFRVQAAATRAAFRHNHAHRLLFLVERDKSDVAKIVAGALMMFDRFPEKANWSTPDGVCYGRGTRSGKLGILFPGQGSQYVGMLRDLACRFPVMCDVLSEANEVYASCAPATANESNRRLHDWIYPHPAFSADARSQQDVELRATQIAQPAIGAVSLGLLAVLEQFGVLPEAVAGHSYGELTALCASKRIVPRMLYRLSMLRGQLMAAAQAADGGMLAVGAPLTQVEAALKELAVDLVVANHNSPTQVVLSGKSHEIERATTLLASRNIRGKKLSVAAAFHSPLVAGASHAFRPVLDDVEFAPPSMPVYANSTAAQYPSEPQAARDLLAMQLAQPVQFVREIEQMYGDGVRTFVEVGPGSVLTGLVNSILHGRDYRAFAVDASGGKRNGLADLGAALLQLSAAGYAVNWDLWDPVQPEQPSSPRMSIPISGANYVKPRAPIPPRPITKPLPTSANSPAPVQVPIVPQIEPSQPVAATNPMIHSRPPASLSVKPTTTRTVEATKGSPPVTNSPSPAAADSVRQAILALERIQRETAELHQQFLAGQQSALELFARLTRQQAEGISIPAPSGNGFTSLPSTPTIPAARSVTEARPTGPANPNAGQSAAVAPVASREVPAVGPPTAPDPSRVQSNPPPAPIVQTTSPVEVSPLAATVLAVVSDKTGYPAEMLNLAMSLDHDLGIDSIKRVEILSALQERVADLPAFQPDELGSLQTLNDVVRLADARMAGRLSTNATSVSATAQLIEVRPISAAASPAVPPTGSSLAPVLLQVVADKTGYPVEMLHLGMSLDHDLGIDSIKRVEILSALQERLPNLPAFQPDELGSLRTLQDVLTLADARVGTSNATPTAAVVPATSASSAVPASPPANPTQNGGLSNVVLHVVAEKTGYPAEMLNLEMSLDHDLGIDSIKRVEILSSLQERVPGLPSFQPDELGALHTLKDVVQLANSRTANAPVVEPVSKSSSSSDVAAPVQIPARDSLPDFTQTVLAVVAEKTGYPAEMLNVRMSLDHDLGIDSIKRVEILSVLQERIPNLPAFQPDELGALQTLQDVVQLAESRLLAQAKGSTQPSTVSTTAVAASAIECPSASCLNPGAPAITAATKQSIDLSVLQRSIVRPVPLSSPDARTRHRIIPGREFWITDDGDGLSLRIADEVAKRGLTPRIVNLDEARSLTVPDSLSGLMIVAPGRGTAQTDLWQSIEWLQRVGTTMRRHDAGTPSLLCTVSRLDGRFGFTPEGPLHDPVSGGLAGLVKSASREWPEITCKAIDLGEGWASANDSAVELVKELFCEGPIEVGITPHGAVALELANPAPSASDPSPPLHRNEVMIVTGGARGVTAAAAFALAQAWHPTLVILGRSPEPAVEPDWLASLITEADVKRALITRAPAGTTPKVIAAQAQQISAEREVASQLRRLRAPGITVRYEPVDVRDAAAVKTVVDRICRESGPVRGLIHGAGVLADQRIEDKTREQFERVYQTKVDGLSALLRALEPNDLRILGLFSSYTARFGRVGQLDYAIANEVLNKMARQYAAKFPHCRVASFNWGPWDGGMVQGGLKALFAAEGIGLIPLDAGAELVVREFQQTGERPTEVLVLAKSPASPLPTSMPMAAASIVPSTLQTNPETQSPADVPVEFRSVFERELSLEQHPFLKSHVLGGKAVLPVAMILEWLAHGAIHRNPGLDLRGFEQFKVYQGVRVTRHDRLSLKVLAGKTVRDGHTFVTPMRLAGVVNGRETLHASANVVLGSEASAIPPVSQSPALQTYPHAIAEAYATRLFHGSHFQGLVSVEGIGREGIVVTSRLAPSPSAWMAQPARGTWLADPLVIDVALQAVILWSQEQLGKPCLPCAAARYQQYRRHFPRDGIRIIVRIQPGTDQLIRCDLDFTDVNGGLVGRLEGCESVAEASLVTAFQRNQLED